MSADLLRRAAAKLREHANATNFGAEGWIVDLNDSEVTTSDGGMMIADTMELTGTRPDASYIALMHPPVALKLAGLLDEAAEYASMQPQRGDWALVNLAVEVARHILRNSAEVDGPPAEVTP